MRCLMGSAKLVGRSNSHVMIMPNSNRDVIQHSNLAVENYIIKEKYHGFDPYDVLNSPVFRLPLFRDSQVLRFGSQQIVKRLPWNIRTLMFIRKGNNPVTYALCLQAFTYLLNVFPSRREHFSNQIDLCINELESLRSKGYSGICWGYDFNWEARYARIPAFTPTIVATGFITNSLFEHYRLTGNERALQLCLDASKFVRNDLHKTVEDSVFCYSYSPLDRQIVFNATMKGARLLSQVFSVTHEKSLAEEAKATVNFVLRHQNIDGSWPYSKGDKREWIDNFHTGYILDCLDEYCTMTRDDVARRQLEKGVNYYVNTFFYDDCIPKYYSNSVYPVDSTAAAQSILTLARFGYVEKAWNVALWMIQNMQDESGYFYYQKHRLFTNKIPYMRWSNAWMYAAMSYILSIQGEKF